MSPRKARAILAAAAAFPAGYILSGALRLPVFAYDPTARTIFWAESVSGQQMRYYGDLLWACAAAGIAGALALAAPSRERAFNAGTAAATAVALASLAVAYFFSRLLAAT
jgi:hypothetical protein